MNRLNIIKYRILSRLYVLIGNELMLMEPGIAFNLQTVVRKVGLYYRVPDYQANNSRARQYVVARQVLATILRNNTNMTLSEIGYIIGKKTHDTVIHCQKTIDNLVETDRQFNKSFLALIRSLHLKYEKYYKSEFIKIRRTV